LQLVRGLVPVGPRRSRLEAMIRQSVEELRRISESLAILREETPRTHSRTVAYG
jgi:hypothetical protein